MTVVIPWTKEDIAYLANEGLRDISPYIQGKLPLQAKYQKMANAVKDFNGDRFARQKLIDTYYDIVNCITKNSLDEWKKYEQEHSEQMKHEKIKKIRENQNNLLSQLYEKTGDRTNLRIWIEEEFNKKLPDNHFVGELFDSWGVQPNDALIYCIGRKTIETASRIDKISEEMQNHIKNGKGYSDEYLIYLNKIVDEVKNIKKDNVIPGINIHLGEKIEEKLAKAYEINALYGSSLLEAICEDRPRTISRDEMQFGFNQIKNLAYKNAINIPSKELSAKMIKQISDVEDKYQNKIQKFSRRYLLKKQDQLFKFAKNAAEDRNSFVFKKSIELKKMDLLGNVLIEDIDTKHQPIFLDNSLQYKKYKQFFENISRNYSFVLEEDEESLNGALKKLDKIYLDSRNVGVKKCFIKNGKMFSEEELEEIYKIYSKMISQSAEKLKISLKNNDQKNVREYCDLTKRLLKERVEEVGIFLENKEKL